MSQRERAFWILLAAIVTGLAFGTGGATAALASGVFLLAFLVVTR